MNYRLAHPVQILTYTDYALRILLYVGEHAGTVPTATIAKAHDISVDHVAKAAKTLTRHGLLRATRGAGGGVELAKPAHEIVLGAVVRLFEDGRGPVMCLRSQTAGRCAIAPACRLKHAFAAATAAFYRELDTYTLADLLTDGAMLIALSSPAANARKRPS